VKKVIVVPQPMGGYRQDGNLLKGALGTSKKAVSSIFEEAVKIIKRETGGRTTIDVIEKAIITDKNYIRVLGEKINIHPILKKASNTIGESLNKELISMLRESNIDIDIILLIGGGARFYEDTARKMFPNSKIVVSELPVQANSHGFWEIAKGAID